MKHLMLYENFKLNEKSHDLDYGERKNALQHLEKLTEIGYIYHDIETGEEWLGIDNEAEIFLGIGNVEDWGKYNGPTDDMSDKLNPKNWETLVEDINLEDVEIPDGHGTTSTKLCFVQKNTNVSNPVNEIEDFELIENNGEFHYIYKRPY